MQVVVGAIAVNLHLSLEEKERQRISNLVYVHAPALQNFYPQIRNYLLVLISQVYIRSNPLSTYLPYG